MIKVTKRGIGLESGRSSKFLLNKSVASMTGTFDQRPITSRCMHAPFFHDLNQPERMGEMGLRHEIFKRESGGQGRLLPNR